MSYDAPFDGLSVREFFPYAFAWEEVLAGQSGATLDVSPSAITTVPKPSGATASTNFIQTIWLVKAAKLLLVPEDFQRPVYYDLDTGEYSDGPQITTSTSNQDLFTCALENPDGTYTLFPRSYANIVTIDPHLGSSPAAILSQVPHGIESNGTLPAVIAACYAEDGHAYVASGRDNILRRWNWRTRRLTAVGEITGMPVPSGSDALSSIQPLPGGDVLLLNALSTGGAYYRVTPSTGATVAVTTNPAAALAGTIDPSGRFVVAAPRGSATLRYYDTQFNNLLIGPAHNSAASQLHHRSVLPLQTGTFMFVPHWDTHIRFWDLAAPLMRTETLSLVSYGAVAGSQNTQWCSAMPGGKYFILTGATISTNLIYTPYATGTVLPAELIGGNFWSHR